MSPAARSWTLRAVQITVAMALFALLWRAADGPDAARSLAQADWRFLALAFLALTVQTLLSATRWRLTARALGMPFGLGHAVREYYLSQVVNQSLPGGMVGDAGRAYRAREQAGLLAAGQAVALERLSGQIALFATLAAGFALTALAPGGLDWPRALALPVAGLIAAGFALPVLVNIAARFGGAVGRMAARLRTLLHTALLHRRILPVQIALGIGTTACNLAAFAMCARAIGVALPLGAIVGLIPLILLTMLVPLTISGWGLREGAAAALLPLAGVAASEALAASVAFGLVFLAATLPGLAVLLFRPRRRPAPDKPEAPDPEPVGR